MQPLYPNRINWQNLPSFDTPLGASNLNKMDYAIYGLDQRVLTLTGYQDSASQSAKNAKASEVNAKASELNASASEELARQYAEQAFSGTPEGYEQLVEDVRLMDIKTTTDTTLADSKAGGYKLVFMRGNSVQNGEPTPDNPIAINNTADCVEMIQGYYDSGTGEYKTSTTAVCSKNLMSCKAGDSIKIAYPTTISQIRVCYYNNGVFVSHVRGSDVSEYTFTAPSNATEFNVCIADTAEITPDTVGKITLTINGKYVLQVKTNWSVELIQGMCSVTNGQHQTNANRLCTKHSITCKSSDEIKVVVPKESVFSAVFFNDDEYVSYYTASSANTTHTFTIPSGVNRFKFNIGYDNITPSTVGNIILTINGVGESVATVLLNEPLRKGDFLFNENGLWKVERKMVGVVLDGTETWYPYSNATYTGFDTRITNMKQESRANGFCTHFASQRSPLGSSIDGITFGGTNDNRLYITFSEERFSTVADFKAWLKEELVEIEYPLATPTIEVLDTASQIALNSLETFDTVTYINVDSRTLPSEIKSEYGTSIVGARTLKNELKNDTLEIKYNELAVALVATGSEV